MSIKVTLDRKGDIKVKPDHLPVDRGSHTVFWQVGSQSETLSFDDPPVTFGVRAPFSAIATDGDVASALDPNNNGGNTDIDYPYELHLIDGDGNRITYPSNGKSGVASGSRQAAATGTASTLTGGDPTIKHRPS